MDTTTTGAIGIEPPAASGSFGGHPKGLSTLFFTEMWERFSYYGMRALLILFMTKSAVDGGLAFDTKKAGAIYGTYAMSVYLLGIPGGWAADRLLGARFAVLLGGIIIACGHFAMAYPSIGTFYLGLVLIAAGTGLLKPNVSTMVGGLYGENDPRRDGGFSIFYMGINLGAFIAPFVTGFLAQTDTFKSVLSRFGLDPRTSWHWGFAAAGVGMTLGLIQYVRNQHKLGDVGLKAKEKTKSSEPVRPADPLTAQEWRRIGVIFILFIFSLMFWAIYEQAGTSFNLFADSLTRDRVLGIKFPSSYFQALPAIFVICQAPIFSWLWIRLGKREPSSPAKFAYGLFFVGLSVLVLVPASMFAGSGKVSPLWLVGVYFLSVVGEMCLSPVGMSTYTKLAPPRLVGLMMGVWFMSIALGNQLAGRLAGLFTNTDTVRLMKLFGYMGLVLLGGALVLALLTPKIRKLMGGVH